MSSLTLFIDLCSHRKLVACVDEKKTLALLDIADHTHEVDLLPAIERMLQTAGLSLQKLARIAAITGPGGFMSQRVAMSLANTLSWSLKIPIAGIHLSDLWFARVPALLTPIPNPKSFLWLHSTQKKSLFIRGFGALQKKWPEATLISIEDLQRSLSPIGGEGQGVGVIGELIPEHAEDLPVKEVESLQAIEEVLPALCGKSVYGKPPMLPWYGRGI